MLKDPKSRLQDFKINSTTTLDDLLKAAANSDEMPTIPPSQSDAAAINPAVDRCCQAYANGLEAAKAKEKSDFASEREAQHAYRSALPPLSGADNIRDFIACVAHGMLIAAIEGPAGARLLYAAQVAYGAIPKPFPARVGRPSIRPLPEDNPSPYPEN